MHVLIKICVALLTPGLFASQVHRNKKYEPPVYYKKIEDKPAAQDKADMPGSSYLGAMLIAISYAKNLHAALAVPNIDTLSSGYQTYQWIMDITEGAIPGSKFNLTYAAVQTLVTTSLATGVAVPGLFYLSYTATAASYAPSLLMFAMGGALPGRKGEYPLDQFTSPLTSQSSPLTCRHNKLWTWATQEDLPPAIQDKNIEKTDLVRLKGRWIKEKNAYEFGAIDDPLKVQAACITSISRLLAARGEELTSLRNISFTSGNTIFTNNLPIVFYAPRLSQHPKSQPHRKLIVKSAVLIRPNP